jgi:hypothetical protein
MSDSHYIDNKLFYAEMVKWKKAIAKAKKAEQPRPPVTDYIGRCFLAIAERLSYRPNFINYPYREEMVGDGIENCLMYAANFDPTKSKNPFSYFTQIIYYAFIRRIQKEKKQNYIKFKCIEMARTNGTVPKWLNQAYNDESKIQDFFKSLSLSDLDLENFKGTKKKEAKEAAKEVVADKVEVVAKVVAKKAAKKVVKKKPKK